MPDRIVSGDSGLAKVVERQMRNWELARSQALAAGETPAKEKERSVYDFLTIANDIGGGGGDIGAMIGERLGWPVFDRQILSAMAADDEVRARLYRSMDERDLGWFEETMRSFAHGEFRKYDYFHRLTETLLFLARKSHAVFVGRAADLILPKDKGLRVKVICPYEMRVANFARHAGIPTKEATRQLERIHAERAAFIARHFKIDILDATRFDLLINVSRFTPQQAVEMILLAMRHRGIAI